MIGRLHPDEVEDLLHHQHVGRLACLAGGRPYVVPITYAYAGGDVYDHALPGRPAKHGGCARRRVPPPADREGGPVRAARVLRPLQRGGR